MPYSIELTDLASDDLNAIRMFYRQRIGDAIDAQLAHEPTIETRNRKMLTGFTPDFEHKPPIWELRVGQYRVLYDVDEESKTVMVRAVQEAAPPDYEGDCMKSVEAGQFAANLDQYLDASRSETSVVTQAGKPRAIVHGLDYDEEQLDLINSKEFWSMIEERRRRPTIPWEVAKKQLGLK